MKSLFFLRLAAILGWCAWTAVAFGQPLENAVFTLGTTTLDAQGRSWAYLVLSPTEPQLLRHRQVAVYAKSGDSASPVPFTRQSIFGVELEPAVLKALIDRARSLGEDVALLETRVDNLFAAVLTDKSLDLPTKLSVVLRGTLDKPDQFGNLVLLGRLHPSVTFALGLGYAQIIPAGQTTFELRDWDAANNRDAGVLGRVTIASGAPLVMPAPGKPALVSDTSGKGHLNAKLRWATSAELRRVALLSQGFDLFRVPKQAAVAAGLNLVNPTYAQLLAVPKMARVNEQPIFKNRDYDTDAQAADLTADPTTFFIADDNGLSKPRPPGVRATRFNNGDQFYYFVAARDLLGRDGFVSPGTLVTLCDRVPPDAPHLPTVENAYQVLGTNESQWLKVSWRPVTNVDAGKQLLGYYVYRWSSPSEALLYADNPVLHRVSAMIPHVAGKTSYSFTDNGLGAPATPTDYDKTFWYTVRVVDDGACDGGNYSANSAAAFGVLRNRHGPAGPSGGPWIRCCYPETIATKRMMSQIGLSEITDTNLVPMDMVCKRLDKGIAWAEFYFAVPQEWTNFLGRLYFTPASDEVVYRAWIRSSTLASTGSQRVYCRTGDAADNPSALVYEATEGVPKLGVLTTFPFTALTYCERVQVRTRGEKPVPGTCTTHRPNTPSGGVITTNEGIDISIVLTPRSKEFKLYRQVDFGPLTLIKQGPGDYNTVTNLVVADRDMPANSGTICYYCQLFDEHGNASPMTPLGPCVTVDLPTATPILNPITALGDAGNPQMTLRWFCSPVGIERFQVWVAASPGSTPNILATELAPDSATHPNMVNVDPAQPTLQSDFAIYATPAPGLNFGPGPEFRLAVPITLGVTYTVQIRTVTKGGTVSQASKFKTFKWKAPPAAVGPEVPWPQAPLAAVSGLLTNVYPERLPDPFYRGVGVRVGHVVRQQLASNTNGTLRPNLRPAVKWTALIFTDDQGESLFPLVLYRYQTGNANYPVVTRDLTQVSPLMDTVALVAGTDLQQQPCWLWRDPFLLVPYSASQLEKDGLPIYLLDTQPVLRGAKYVYLLVRFGADGEPKDIIPTAPVEVLP